MPRKLAKKPVAPAHTGSAYPDPGLFNKDARTIAEELASVSVPPEGSKSGLRMLTYYINRAGHDLPESRRAELERAKRLLHKKIEEQDDRRQRAS